MKFCVPAHLAENSDLKEIFFDSVPWDADKLKQEILQFTGLIDKSGREIYEGDIVNFTVPGHAHGPESEDYKNHLVKWDEAQACWGFWSNGIEPYSYTIPGDRIDVASFKVAGNMFENPELLKS